MAKDDSDLTFEFDTGDEDDITNGALLEALKTIKTDTSTLADWAVKKQEQTPIDQSIKTQANQKSKLEETDKFQNANQDRDVTQEPALTLYSQKPKDEVMDALHEINYSILGLGAGLAAGRKEKPEVRTADAQTVKEEALENDHEAHEAKTAGAKETKESKKTSFQHPFRNAGTDMFDQYHSKLSNHYNRFKSWYTKGMSDEEIAAASAKGSASFDPIIGAMTGVEGAAEKLIPVVAGISAAIGAVGGIDKWGRAMKQDEINEGVGLGGAIGNTMSDAGEDIAHKLGFTANTGRDLQEYRQGALANNWALYSGKADTYYDTRKWATNEGLTKQADTDWIQEMTALGLSTNQIRTQFEGLSAVSKQVGVSFQNLSQAVAQESTTAEKQLGKQNSKGVEEGVVEAQEADQKLGLQAGTLQKIAMSQNGQSYMAQVLDASGHAGQAETAAGDASLMWTDIVKDHLASAFAQSAFASAYQSALGEWSSNPTANKADEEQALVRNANALLGLSASDYKSSADQLFKFMGNGAMPSSSTYGGALSTEGQALQKTLPTIKTDIQIGLSKGMEAKIANSNGMSKGLFDTEGTNNYYHIQNKWAFDR